MTTINTFIFAKWLKTLHWKCILFHNILIWKIISIRRYMDVLCNLSTNQSNSRSKSSSLILLLHILNESNSIYVIIPISDVEYSLSSTAGFSTQSENFFFSWSTKEIVVNCFIMGNSLKIPHEILITCLICVELTSNMCLELVEKM